MVEHVHVHDVDDIIIDSKIYNNLFAVYGVTGTDSICVVTDDAKPVAISYLLYYYIYYIFYLLASLA